MFWKLLPFLFLIIESSLFVTGKPTEITQQVQTVTENNKIQNLNSGIFLEADKDLSPIQRENDNDLGLIEVNENELPEGSEIYVMEEPVQIQERDGDELLETANNIVFRPLFRYKNKQQALRRVSPGLRRRYFVPKRYYRRTYQPYYYYNQGYYYN